jgi:hypothetical protein
MSSSSGGTERGPGERAARTARGAIEDALFAFPDIPLRFDREDLADRLLHAVQRLYAVLDSPVTAIAHLDGLGQGAAMVTESAAILGRAGDASSCEPLRRALQRLGEAEQALRHGAEAVAQIQVFRRGELIYGSSEVTVMLARPFVASVGLPALHAITRPMLRPLVVVDTEHPVDEPAPPPSAVPRPATPEELAAFLTDAASGSLAARYFAPAPTPEARASDEGARLAHEPAIEEVEVLRDLGRACLADIANNRNLRKPNALETWLDQAAFEQRLFDNVDAFAALGGAVLPLVSLFHAEAKAPDPERAFAVALTLGCIEGHDTTGSAVMALKQSPPEEFPGWIEGFWLAPSPAIDAAMADLCTSPRSEMVALALEVLDARGPAPDDVLTALVDRPEPEIARRVARALATALPRRDAIAQLERIGATTNDDELFLATLVSLLRRGHGPALDLLRRTIDSPISPARSQKALPLLCFVGRAGDLDRLLTAARNTPTVRLVRGLGRFGHVESLGALVDLLGHEDEDIVAAAAEALDRITGAGLREIIEEPWEIELPPEAEAAGGIPIPTRKVERIVTDPERWAAWMRDNAERLDPKAKTRSGIPFTPLQIVAELEAKGTPPEHREEAALELRLMTGITSAFSPHDWVARQQKHLAELRQQVAAMPASPGAWSLSAHRLAATEALLDEPAPPPPRADPPAIKLASSLSSTGVLDLSPELIARFVAGALPFRRNAGSAAGDESAEGPKTVPPLVSRGADLPFQPQDPVLTAAMIASAPAAPTKPAPTSEGPRTAPLPAIVFPRPALPFEETRHTSSSTTPALSENTEPTRASPAALSLEQYAGLCAELFVFPGQAEAIYRRYGLIDLGERRAFDHLWQERLRRNPAQEQEWQGRYRHYVAYWTERRTRGPA